jgi:hypothetical protein
MALAYTALPDPSVLWEAFDYKPLTGELIWRNIGRRKVVPGCAAGVKTKSDGYVRIGFNLRRYLGHRLVWVWLYGKDPSKAEIDHINGVRHDNRLNNLRLATRSQNSINAPVKSSSKTGVKGVWMRGDGRYRARIRHNHKIYNLGAFDTIDEASAAYKKASEHLHGEFARLS